MAESSETIEDVDKGSSCLGSSKSSKKRESSIQKNDSGITMEGSDSSGDETIKKSKTEENNDEKDEDKASSSFRRRNSSSRRSYRTRTLASSSSSENEEKDTTDLGDTRRPIDLSGGNMVITSASEMDDASLDTTSSLDPDNTETTSPLPAMETGSSTSAANEPEANAEVSPAPGRCRRRPFGLLGGLQSDTDSDDDDRDTPTNNGDTAEAEAKRKTVEEAIEKELNKIKTKPQPKNTWNFVDQIVQRQLGGRAHQQQSVLFSQHYYDSLHVPRRLELMSKLKMHRGCVNALSFNTSCMYLLEIGVPIKRN